MKSPYENVNLSLHGLFKKHDIFYKVKKTKSSSYFTVYVGDKELLLRVSDHDQPSWINKQKPDFELRIKKDYNSVKKVIKGLKYDAKSEC